MELGYEEPSTVNPHETVNGATRVGSKRSPKRGRMPASESPVQTHYMRDLGTSRCLDRAEELVLAVELQSAWESYAALMFDLPHSLRERVLADDAEGPQLGRKWPWQRLDASYRRLEACRGDWPEAGAMLGRATRVKRRVDRAREALITANLALVVGMAKGLKNRGIPFLDLVQEGNLGLMMAADRFEHERGFRFSSYAVWWIKRGFSKAFVEKSRLIRLPENTAMALTRLKRESTALALELGRRPTPEEVAEKIDVPVEKVVELINASHDPRPLERVGADDADFQLIKHVSATGVPDPLETSMDRQMVGDVNEALTVLSPREKQILQLRYGIGVERRHTLKQIGAILSLSRERVRQIELRALAKIHSERHALIEHLMRRRHGRPGAASS